MGATLKNKLHYIKKSMKFGKIKKRKGLEKFINIKNENPLCKE